MPKSKKGLNKDRTDVIKVCNLSIFYFTYPQLFSEKHKKRLDIPLTLVYTVYVD